MGVCRWLGSLLLALMPLPLHAVEIDGRIDPEEWKDARHVTDFRKVQPLNGEPATLTTEAWILATPDGLAVAFRNIQPPSVPRTLQRVQRDFEEQVDRVNVMIDFDGDHRTGYDFTISCTDGIADAIITNENNFNDDWDGNWRHAVVSNDEEWTAEVLLPWHLAPMRGAGDKRTLSIYLDRVVGSTGERAGWPLASFERPRFLSDFAPIEVANFKPVAAGHHAVCLRPLRQHRQEQRRRRRRGLSSGSRMARCSSPPRSIRISARWKATTWWSISAPRKPSSATSGRSSPRTRASSNSPRRRISASCCTRGAWAVPADDGEGAGDITAALKLNGSVGNAKYGLFAADEAESVGRTFAAARGVRDFNKQNLGFMATWVDRPYLDRQATVVGVDHNWRPTARWNVRTRVFGSDIDQSGESSRDTGATLWADYEMDHGWRQQVIAMHFGNELNINDAGYLARNSMNYIHYEVKKRFSEQPKESRYASKDWRWRVSTNYNDRGDALGNQFRISRESQLRNGSYEYGQINVNSAGYDDLLTRGNGNLWVPANFNSYFDYQRPRHGRWGYEFELNLFSGGLSGNDKVGYTIHFEPKYFISDAFNVYVGALHDFTPDWLIWDRENLIGSYREHQTNFDLGFNWIMTNRHELRLKLQAIALSADLQQAYRVEDGSAVPTDEPVDDFSVETLGVQLRYRFEFKPLSYLYVVYARGGYQQDPTADGTGQPDQATGFSLRDDEQLLVKFSYRFEN